MVHKRVRISDIVSLVLIVLNIELIIFFQQGKAFNNQPIEDIFGMVIEALTPERSCQAHLAIHRWIRDIAERKEREDMKPLFTEVCFSFHSRDGERLPTFNGDRSEIKYFVLCLL